MESKIKKKIVSNVSYLSINYVFVTLFSFIFWLIIGKTQPPEGYGILTTSINLALLLSAVGLLGFDGPLSKLIPEFVEKKNFGAMVKLIRFSLRAVLLFNLFIFSLLFLFSNQLGNMLGIESNFMILIGGLMILNSIYLIFITIQYGLQKMRRYFISNFLGQTTKVLVTLLLVYLGYGYFEILIGFGLSILISILMASNKIWTNKIDYELDKKNVMKMYAMPFFISYIFSTIYLRSPQIILNSLEGPANTGLFSIALNIVTPLGLIGSVLGRAIFPITSGLSAKKMRKNISNLINATIRYNLLFTVPLAVILISFSKFIILLFSKTDYLVASNFLPILTLAALILSLARIFKTSLYAIGEPILYRNETIIMSIVFMFLVLPLTHLFSIWGVCFSVLIANMISLIVSSSYLRRRVNIKIEMLDIMKILLAASVYFAYIYLFSKATSGIGANLIIGISGLLFYFVALFLLKFYRQSDFELIENTIPKSLIFRKTIIKFINYVRKIYEKIH